MNIDYTGWHHVGHLAIESKAEANWFSMQLFAAINYLKDKENNGATTPMEECALSWLLLGGIDREPHSVTGATGLVRTE